MEMVLTGVVITLVVLVMALSNPACWVLSRAREEVKPWKRS